MKLHSLPRFGETDNPRVGYKIHDSAWVDGDTVVLGQATVDGQLSDWFVARYDEHGARLGGGVTTASYPTAREFFDARSRA